MKKVLNFKDCLNLRPPKLLDPHKVHFASEYETLINIESSGHLNPIQARRLSELRASGGYGNPTGEYTPGMSGDYRPGEFERVTTEKYMNAIKPTIDSLEASIPEVSQRFGEQKELTGKSKDILQDRYDTLLSELTGKETQQKTSAQLNLAREFGRRGIPLSSSAFGAEVNANVNPITDFYSTQRKGATESLAEGMLNIDKLLADLTGQEVDTIRAIRNSMAQIQTGAATKGVDTGVTYLLQEMQNKAMKEAEDRRLAETKRQFDLTQALSQKIYETINLPESQYAVSKPYYKESSSGGSGGGSSNYLSYYGNTSDPIDNLLNQTGGSGRYSLVK